jgi:transposase
MRHLRVGAVAAAGRGGCRGLRPADAVGLLVYAYCQGVRSSRQIERLCLTDVAFRVLCAQDGPDHTTIARFRAEGQEAFLDLLAQVLMIAARAGLGRFGTVAIDATKIAANASIDANRGKDWFDRARRGHARRRRPHRPGRRQRRTCQPGH